MRICHKAETESKTEIRKNQLRYDTQLAQVQKSMERRIEELEDKLNMAQDENEERRNAQERMERQC